MNLVRVVYVDLEILPATFNFCGRDLGVVKEDRVSEQQVADTVKGLLAASLNRGLLVSCSAPARFVFEVMTEQSADLEIV